MMQSGEMCDAILKGGIGETVKLEGGADDLLSAMRELKHDEVPISCDIELNLSCFEGTDIRKVRLEDANEVFEVFDKFTKADNGKLKKPVIDAEHNGLVSADGWKMLACRIPTGFPIADAVFSGFSADVTFRWREIAEELEPTDYNLLCFRRMATIRKGDYRHGYLQAVRGAVKSYEYEGSDGFFHTLDLRMGGKVYESAAIADIVDSIFMLGCAKVAICEKRIGDDVSAYSPIHIFGYGGEVDAKGIVMPRRTDDSTGAFVMPLEETAKGKKGT